MSRVKSSGVNNGKKNWTDTLQALVDGKVFPQAVHRLLLNGPPGTGKSSWGEYAFPGKTERITLHRQMPVEDLIGSWQLQNGSTVWSDGPAIRAMRQGKVLILDEIDQYSPELRCALNAVLDDRAIAGVTLPTGERVRPAPGFAVIGTTNAEPASLNEALRDRFEIIILANTPANGLLDQLEPASRKLLSNHYARSTQSNYSAPLSARALLAFHKIASALPNEDKAHAAALVFADNADEILSSLAVAE